MATLEERLAQYQAGDELVGGNVRLTRGVLWQGAEPFPLGRIASARVVAGRLVVYGYGGSELLAEPIEAIDQPEQWAALITRLAEAVPYLERRAPWGWPPGSIGDISSQIGYDVRDLFISGYSDEQIWRVRRHEISLEQLLSETPAGRRDSLRQRRSGSVLASTRTGARARRSRT